MSRKPNVVITGFGPFGDQIVNNSWICVQKLKESGIENSLCINMIIKEIPVSYKASDEIVPSLWETYDPILVIHVGVHRENGIILEKQACKDGYKRLDVESFCPSDGNCTLGCESILETKFTLENFNSVCKTKLSNDAGRYLCEYTYYLSLSHNAGKSLFVHIPPASSNISTEYITDQLKLIVEECLKQINGIKS